MRLDQDRRHPLHDALCAFLTDEAVALQLMSALFATGSAEHVRTNHMRRPSHNDGGNQWPGEDHSGYDTRGVKFRGIRSPWSIDEESVSTTLEQPVYGERGRAKIIVGYLDAYVTACRTRSYSGCCSWRREHSPHPIDGRYVYEYDDESVEGEWFQSDEVACAVEVKAKISSLGELIRQVQKYRHEWSHDPDVERPAKWVVMSPGITPGIVDLLKGQDIIGIKPSPQFLAWADTHGLALPLDARRLAGDQTQLELGA